ncbi:Outer membrane usher protein FimD precursor [compost metagenome]
MNASKQSGTTHSVGLSGMAMENNALNWNVQQGYGTNDVGYTGAMNVDYRGTYGEATVGYGYDKNSDRMNYGVQGGILAHADGVTFSQPLGETNVLIKAPGAKGVSIQNQTGAKTDWRGYTTVSNVTVYRKNDVALLTETLPEDVELELTNRTVTPTRGAVVRANYVTNVGLRALITLMQPGAIPVPFGAIVNVDGQSGQGFIVGEGGQVYLTGLNPKGSLTVKWGNDSDKACRAEYSSRAENNHSGVQSMNVICR